MQNLEIIRMQLIGFGKFRDRTIELSPELNLLEGPNEAGKSTIQAFLTGMFYGFFQPGTKRRSYTLHRDKYQPWDGGSYRGVLVCRNEERAWRIERTFDKDSESVKVYDDLTGDDLTLDFAYNTVTRQVQVGEKLLGLSKTAFNNTANIAQMTCASVAQESGFSAEVSDKLLSMMKTADSSLSLSAVIHQLDSKAEQIGSPKKSKTPYGIESLREKELVEELEEAEKNEAEYQNLCEQGKSLSGEIQQLEKMGVKIDTDMVMGKVLSVDELFEMGYEALYIGTGAGLPNFMNLPGEGLVGVYSANEFLTRINLMKAYLPEYDTPIIHPKNVAVVGGGNVAMDAARCAKRLGAENVYIIYRRSEEEMPARNEEIHHAKEEEIIFKLLNNPVAIHGDEQGKVKQIECVEMELGEPDASGRRRPIEKKGSNFLLDVDCVVIAIGNSPNPLIRSTTEGLEANKKGCIIVDDNTLQTTREGVYAGGDAVTGAATVILAMGAGKHAAKSIDEYIQSKADQ